MAQRYGRKRRRAHAAKIAELNGQLTTLASVVEMARRDIVRAERRSERMLKHLEDWDRDVRYLLGPHSALQFATPDLPTRGDPRDIRRLPVPDPMQLGPLAVSELPDDAIAYRIADLHHALFKVSEERLFELRTYMRLTVSGVGGASYAFTEGYWKTFSGDHAPAQRDIARVARDIADIMLRKIGEPKKRPPRQE